MVEKRDEEREEQQAAEEAPAAAAPEEVQPAEPAAPAKPAVMTIPIPEKTKARLAPLEAQRIAQLQAAEQTQQRMVDIAQTVLDNMDGLPEGTLVGLNARTGTVQYQLKEAPTGVPAGKVLPMNRAARRQAPRSRRK